jgi:uncharacterized protein (DUF2345 family)
MEQQYQLKRGAGYSIFEQAQMPAEERAWVMRRIERENKERQEAERNANASMPRMPRMPSRR